MTVASKEQSFPLGEAIGGTTLVVKDLAPGPQHARVAELGLVTGTTLHVDRVIGNGALIVQVRGATIAIDRQLSMGIQVTPATDASP